MRYFMAITILGLTLSLASCFGQEKPQAWEHGWKTSRVVATRYTSKTMGQHIGFKFPHNGYDCDREEVSQFIQMHGGNIFWGGGYPGAEAFAVFKGVKDAANADRKLQEILPGLTKLMENLDNKAYMREFAAQYKKWDLATNPQWPDTTPPDKTNPYWEFNNNMNANGVQYRKVEVTPGKWQWKVDEESMKQIADMENHRRSLYQALTTRVLTDKEMKEAESYGDMLNIELMVSYNATDKKIELQNAFLVQYRIREAQKHEGK